MLQKPRLAEAVCDVRAPTLVCLASMSPRSMELACCHPTSVLPVDICQPAHSLPSCAGQRANSPPLLALPAGTEAPQGAYSYQFKLGSAGTK